MRNQPRRNSEPDFETACQWWSDLPNIWTPVGWKDHLFRFNVYWEGTVTAQPHLNRRTTAWQDQGVQISFAPIGVLCTGDDGGCTGDDGLHTQGWNAGEPPVLWTRRFLNSILFQQEIFAHVPGGQAVEKGDEPLFAWVRLSLADVIEDLPQDDRSGFTIIIQAVHTCHHMNNRNNTWLALQKALYPRALNLQGKTPGAVRVVEPDGRIRLGVAANARCRAIFRAPFRNYTAYNLKLDLELRKGASVDVLLPMLPMDRKIFDRELAVGYDGALREARAFWSPQPATRASIRVPEAEVTEAIRQSERFSPLLAEKNPGTGKYCKLSGSLVYADLWSTPMAMDMVMLMDTLGHHEFVERYLDIFREEQGTVVPPGDAYRPHPGYFSSPAAYKSVDWISDNGAILYSLAMHGLLSGRPSYLRRFTEAILKSCDWIKTHRALKGHGGYEGILPAGVATDAGTRIQAVWNDGWNYRGLCAAGRLLKRIGHPRAAEFAREAADYRAAYRTALRDKCRRMPAWKDAEGRTHVLVPTALSGDKPSETRHAFYLDSGPLFLVFAGLVDAADPLMQDVRSWFRHGPQWKYYRHDSLPWQTPVLDHEISSCEPCYSWNVFHSWQLGDRSKFLDGMYSLFAGAISRKTQISCETRGGITGNLFAAPLAVYLARLAVVDDQLREDQLHLLRLMPLAWLKPGDETAFEKMPTEFGTVTLQTKMSADGKNLDVAFQPAFRKGQEPKRVVIHVPPIPGLRKCRMNGAVLKSSGEIRW